MKVEWPAPDAVRAVCTRRPGGISSTPYDALNLGDHVGDSPAAVLENRARLRKLARLPSEPLWLTQVHGVDVIHADVTHSGAPRGDAAFTHTAGRVLAILTADCLPVLLCRRDGGGVAAAHAGWRGLAAGVLEATVAALAAPGDELLAWLGPAIGQQHFEVGAEVRAAFCDRDPSASAAFLPNARGRWQCDLDRLARNRLHALGVSAIYGTPQCTYSQPRAYFSHRRDGVTGRMAALVWIERTVP
jgi:YfiH family protein